MRRIVGVFVVLSLLMPLGVQGQQTPGMEKVQFWVGDWAYEVGEGHGTMKFEQFGNLIHALEPYTNPSGNTIMYTHVMGYDAEEGVYWWHRYVRSQNPLSLKGTVDGNTWTWVTEESEGRKTRMVQVVESEDVIQFRWERSVDGGPWEVTSRGTTRRVK